MSSSSEFSESSGKNPARSPARSSFSQKCSLFSQYLKEKGSFGDLSLGLTGNAEGNNQELFRGPMIFPQSRQIKSMNLFPEEAGFGSTKEEAPKAVADNNSALNAGTAPMTIFYAGQVIVFDDFPADKAKELMDLARRSSSHCYSTSTSNLTGTGADRPCEIVKVPNELGRGMISIPRTPEPIVCDLPIARRNSLHRFLEKRKDRITARAPYAPTSGKGAPLPSKPAEDNKPWLSLAAQRH